MYIIFSKYSHQVFYNFPSSLAANNGAVKSNWWPQSVHSGAISSPPAKKKRRSPFCRIDLQAKYLKPHWLATLIAGPLDLGSNPGEDMDVCKCIVPSLVRLVEGEERWEAPAPKGVLPKSWNGTELSHSVTCVVLKTTANCWRHLTLCHNEVRRP
ncbi:uncharacterized protein TNCV_23381 [Trichonephila clavipes]|nr:uncharacterized protein TNCV_23381 [Trichonephila clavipes]